MLKLIIFILFFGWVPVLIASIIINLVKDNNHSGRHSSYTPKRSRSDGWIGGGVWLRSSADEPKKDNSSGFIQDDFEETNSLYNHNDSHIYDESIEMLRQEEAENEAFRERDVMDPGTWAENDFWV